MSVGKKNKQQENVMIEWNDVDGENLFEGKVKIDKVMTHATDLLMFGVPSSDRRGHSNQVSFRIMPIFGDIVEAISEEMPIGWIKNRSAIMRSACVAGLYVFTEVVKQYKDKLKGNVELSEKDMLLCSENIIKLTRLIHAMNVIGKKQREIETLNEIDTLYDTVKFSKIENRDDVLKELDELYGNIEVIFESEYGLMCEQDMSIAGGEMCG